MLFSVPPFVSLRILRTWGFAEEVDDENIGENYFWLLSDGNLIQFIVVQCRWSLWDSSPPKLSICPCTSTASTGTSAQRWRRAAAPSQGGNTWALGENLLQS